MAPASAPEKYHIPGEGGGRVGDKPFGVGRVSPAPVKPSPPDPPALTVFSIRDVEKLTGIRAHTLRAWEQRYGLVTPRRSDSNARFYHDEELRELSAIALLKKHGYRISKIAAMPRDERDRAVAKVFSLNVGVVNQLDALTLAVVEMDEYRLSLLLDTHIDQLGFEEAMLRVVHPFLEKLSVLFFTGSVKAAQESFVGEILRRKIHSAIDQLARVAPTAASPTFALYLPGGERQEQSILFVQYLLRARGLRALYLGTNTTPGDLADACAATPIDYLYTSLSTTYVAQPVEQMVEQTLAHCKDARLLLTGYQAGLHDFSHLPRVTTLGGLNELLDFLRALSTPADRNTVPG